MLLTFQVSAFQSSGPPVIATSSTNSCAGEIFISVTAGTPPYRYQWEDSNGNVLPFTSSFANNLSPDFYRVTVTDQNNLSVSQTYEITEAPDLFGTVEVNDVTCLDADDGQVVVTMGIGVPTYSWELFNSAGDQVQMGEVPFPNIVIIINGLAVDSYDLYVTDSYGCTGIIPFAVEQPMMMLGASLVSGEDATCSDLANGSLTVSASGGWGDYNYEWVNTATGAVVGHGNSISGLAPGTYTANIRDANGCEVNPTYTIGSPDPITVSHVITHVLCNGEANGGIDLNIQGGTGAYDILWDHGASSENISGLSAGNYRVTITDENSCSYTEIFTINEPAAPLTIHELINNVSCFEGANGAIYSNISGGVAPYTYLWSTGSNTTNLENITEGIYHLTVTDANGCTVSGSFTVTESPELTENQVVIEAPSCFGGNDGSLEITMQGGNPPYTYEWFDGSSGTSVFGLSAGTYGLTVVDANGCRFEGSYTVADPTRISVYTTFSSPTCPGSSDGSIILTPSDGLPPYTYDWEGRPDRGSTLNDISAGIYTVTVTDANGCSVTEDITLNDPSGIQGNATINHISCNGLADGSIYLAPTGGVGPYAYAWSDNEGILDHRTDLGPGDYTVTIWDVNGCSVEETYTIIDPPALFADYTVMNVNCNGGFTGGIDLTVTGGTLPYSFSWSTGEITEDLENLTAGNYSVTVTDVNGCSFVIDPIIINEPVSALNYQINTISNINCNGASNGTIDIEVLGGEPPYDYLWSNGSVTEDLFGLSAGDYNLQVTDNNGCILTTEVFTITEPDVMSIDTVINQVSCHGAGDGSVDLSVSGGTAPYVFTWSDGFSNVEDRTGLSPGDYTVTVTDANGCAESISFTITSPEALTATFRKEDVLCFEDRSGSIDLTVTGGTQPYVFSWSSGEAIEDLENLPAGDYVVTVTDANGCEVTMEITIESPELALSYTETSTNITCSSLGTIDIEVLGGEPPYDYLWSNGSVTEDLFGLSAGDYNLQVTDNNGCVLTTEVFTITEPDVMSIDTVINQVSCHGAGDGSVDLSVSGGTAPYVFTWSDGFSNVEDRTGLSPGDYTVTVTDANGCAESISFTITSPEALTATFRKEDVLCFEDRSGSIDLTVTGGTQPYVFSWSSGEAIEDLENLPAGDYVVTVTDANGCEMIMEITIESPEFPLSVSGVVSDESCAGVSDGTIDLTVSGGAPPYRYQWGNGLETEDIEGLLPGVYQVTVIDNNGCSIQETYRVAGNAILQLEGLGTNLSCNGANDGTIDLTVIGGVAPYTYHWSNGTDTEDISNLSAGDHSVEVIDANGCSAQAAFTLTEPLPLVINYLVTNVSCFGETDGSIDVAASGGTAPYTYRWSNGANEEGIHLLDAGTYTIFVTDSIGCQVTQEIVVEAPESVLTATAVIRPALCNGLPSGGIDITVTGGTEPYTYSWSNGSVQPNLANVFAGTYAVTVTDIRGCTFSSIYEVGQGSSLAASLDAAHPSCTGDSDGSIIVTPSGGQAPYDYLWSNGSVSKDLIDIPAGTYSVTVTDANGCSTVESITIENAGQLNAEIEKINLVCRGASTGAIDLTPNGGSPPYTYSWSHGADTEDLVNIPAGVYSVIMTDANGCSFEESIIISEPSQALSFDIYQSPDMKCFGDQSGFASIGNIRGGVGPYDIRWSTGADTEAVDGLSAGDYSVMVTDANGCSVTQTVTIAQPEAPIAANFSGKLELDCTGASDGYVSITPAYGNPPYTYLWSNGSTNDRIENLEAGTYTVRIVDVNGCVGEETIQITEPTPLSLEANVTDALACENANSGAVDLTVFGGAPPYSYAWSNGRSTSSLTDAPPGIYNVMVTDANGCSINSSYTVNRHERLEVSLRMEMEIDCNTQRAYQRVTATAYGGSGTYSYQWNRGNSTANQAVVDQGGLLSVTVIDQQLGCGSTATVNVPRLPVIGDADFTYHSEEAIDNVGEFVMNVPITFQDLSVGDIIDWEWSFGDSFGSNEINPVHTYTGPGIYTVRLETTNVTGCKAVTQQEIEITQGYRVMLPNAFTPNQDGNNDFFRPSMKGLVEAELFIFNTWGEVIFHGEGLNSKGWDGMVKGQPAENGNYLFKVIGKALSGEKIERHGVFALMK